jgi:hypothetical protein
MLTILATGLLVLDCTVIILWVGGFVLLPLGYLHGTRYVIHATIVLATMVGQILWGFRCPLMVWRNQLLRSTTDILNPFLIQLIMKLFRVEHRTANIILSGIIFAGGIFYLLQLLKL